MPPEARCYVEISRSTIAANYRAVRDAVAPNTGVIGVVKADAYGHGAIEVSRILCNEGVEWLAVSSVDEGVALRSAAIDRRILVMAGVMPWECGALAEYSLTPVAHSLEELKALNERCAGGIRVHLKIDTGMNRLGTRARAEEIAAAAAAAPNVKIEGLMSHFASASDFTSDQTEYQIGVFHEMKKFLATEGLFPPVLHFASTNAVAYPRRDAWLSLVRTGHAIYGYVSPPRGHAPAPALRVSPALQWKTRIVLVKDVPAGARIGYGGAFVAQTPMRIAVLSAGYADGVPHRLSSRGKVIAGGKFAPIVGPVSMDLTTIDITGSPQLSPGDPVTLLGREGDVYLDAQQIARTAGTISYNVLCGISARVKRIYVE